MDFHGISTDIESKTPLEFRIPLFSARNAPLMVSKRKGNIPPHPETVNTLIIGTEIVIVKKSKISMSRTGETPLKIFIQIMLDS